MIWYGLTKDEADLRCASLGLQAVFTFTADPKAKAPDEAATGAMKVIRAKEEAGAMILLLGCFARETGDASDYGD